MKLWILKLCWLRVIILLSSMGWVLLVLFQRIIYAKMSQFLVSLCNNLKLGLRLDSISEFWVLCDWTAWLTGQMHRTEQNETKSGAWTNWSQNWTASTSPAFIFLKMFLKCCFEKCWPNFMRTISNTNSCVVDREFRIKPLSFIHYSWLLLSFIHNSWLLLTANDRPLQTFCFKFHLGCHSRLL